MLLLLTVASALAEGKWDSAVADVEATATVPASPETVMSFLLDLNNLKSIFPEDCIGKWEMGDRTFGEGASAIVRYDMGLMHRRLAMTLTHAMAPTSVDFDHLGKRGFITRWTLTPTEGGTQVRILTPLNAPPKPLKEYFFMNVHPEWKGCYERTLAALATSVPR